MKKLDLASLRPGDLVRHLGTKETYVVTANYGDRVTAVQTADLTNPSEWEHVPLPPRDDPKNEGA